MRDINRIDEFCDRLKEVWKEYPDLRFFQFIDNIMNCYGSDMYYIEDDEAISIIEKVKTKVTPKLHYNVSLLQDDLKQELEEIKEDIKRIYENQEKGMK